MMPMTHWSHSPFVFDREREYPMPRLGRLQPNGLWLAPGTSYKERHDSTYGNKSLTYGVSVKMDSTRLDDILIVGSIDANPEFSQMSIRDFHNEYRIQTPSMSGRIDWRKVRYDYSAIYVEPNTKEYLYGHMEWYSLWPYISMCVWDLSLILKVRRILIIQKTS